LTVTVTPETLTGTADADMNKFLTDSLDSSGFLALLGKQGMWTMIKENPYVSGVSGADIEFTDDYHIRTKFTALVSDSEVDEEDREYAPYINQDKTKIKIILPEDIGAYITLNGGEEVAFILYKKQGKFLSF
jgi:hypothetical protein